MYYSAKTGRRKRFDAYDVELLIMPTVKPDVLLQFGIVGSLYAKTSCRSTI